MTFRTHGYIMGLAQAETWRGLQGRRKPIVETRLYAKWETLTEEARKGMHNCPTCGQRAGFEIEMIDTGSVLREAVGDNKNFMTTLTCLNCYAVTRV